jgi:Mn-dependent DtxR family transcriptional regulator
MGKKLKHQLVCRYSENNLAEYLLTSQSSVSKYLKELEEEGFIKIIKITTRKTILNYYQLGTWEGKYGEESYKESIWLKDIFSMFVLKHKKESKKAGELLRESYGDDLLWKLDFGNELEEDEKVPELSKT